MGIKGTSMLPLKEQLLAKAIAEELAKVLQPMIEQMVVQRAER